MMGWHRTHGERGMSISMAVMALTMVSFIMLYVGTQALNSMYTARKKSDRSVGMAAGDSGIEKYRAALQQGLADETNQYLLNELELKSLVERQDGATVKSNAATSVAAGMTDVSSRIPDWARYTVVERGTDSVGHWQVFDVLQPRYYDSPTTPASDLVVYIRAWATALDSSAITTKPRIFRIEYRPGFFSDYQFVTDAPFIASNFGTSNINGPIHSNGYSSASFLAQEPPGTFRTGIYYANSPNCGAKARFSTSQGAPIVVNGASCTTAVDAARTDARQISLLGVQDLFAKMQKRCPSVLVVCPTTLPQNTVRLGNNQVTVNGTSYSLQTAATSPGNAALAVLLDGDVVLSGSLQTPAGVAGRVTIATRRLSSGDRAPRVFLRNPGSPNLPVVGSLSLRNSVGVVTQGDIVMDGRSDYACLKRVNLAAVSSAGSITIAPELVTQAAPATDLTNRSCPNLRMEGSFAAHGQLVAALRWPDVRNPGTFTPVVGYNGSDLRYNDNFFLSPPPFFPTATPWAVTKVKDADSRCLTTTSIAGDPTCE